MNKLLAKYTAINSVTRYRIRRILYVALAWTFIDMVFSILSYYPFQQDPFYSILIRAVVVFIISILMGYLYIFGFRGFDKSHSLWASFILKVLLILVAAVLMNFFVSLIEDTIFGEERLGSSVKQFFTQHLEPIYLVKRSFYWFSIFLVTQLYLEINDKYSPGVFWDILTGKYKQPKIENRIVMFLDLKDSTPIAEKLGHQQYFLFIRDFIHYISEALISHHAIIYQYVGDEIVTSWPYSKSNARKALAAVISSRKNIQRKSEHFRRTFGVIPEFRVGIHVGNVTIGEIGIIKKDLAMSGDTMNTAARIRSACNELNQKFVVSKEFIENSPLKEWQSENLGAIELKGKAEAIELYSLKI